MIAAYLNAAEMGQLLPFTLWHLQHVCISTPSAFLFIFFYFGNLFHSEKHFLNGTFAAHPKSTSTCNI